MRDMTLQPHRPNAKPAFRCMKTATEHSDLYVPSAKASVDRANLDRPPLLPLNTTSPAQSYRDQALALDRGSKGRTSRTPASSRERHRRVLLRVPRLRSERRSCSVLLAGSL